MGQILEKARAARDALAAARRGAAPGNAGDVPALKDWIAGSKVVDDEGRPLVVYHGTTAAAFTDFKIPAFFTSDRSGAEWYMHGEEDGRVEELYLSIRNPLDIRTQAGAFEFITIARNAGVQINSDITPDGGPWSFEADEIAEHSPYDGTNVPDLIYIPAVQAAVQALGYDGLRVADTLSNGDIPVWVALRADQIKRVAPTEGAAMLDSVPERDAERLQAYTVLHADLIDAMHKISRMDFKSMPAEQFDGASSILLYQSPDAEDGRPGSTYRLVMLDDEPVWARKSDHWGVLGSVDDQFEWSLDGGEHFGERVAGYVPLRQGLHMAVDGWLLDDAKLSAMERVRIAAEISTLVARFGDSGLSLRERVKTAAELRALVGRLGAAPSSATSEHPALVALRGIVAKNASDIDLVAVLDKIGEAIYDLRDAEAFDDAAADIASAAITKWAEAEEQQNAGAHK